MFKVGETTMPIADAKQVIGSSHPAEHVPNMFAAMVHGH